MNAVKGTLNRVELIGRLGADPEMRFLSSGKAVCRFNLATNRTVGQSEEGARIYETEWTQIEAWEQLAEQCNSFLHKGRRVMISGSLRTDSWADKENGQTRYRTYVRAREVLFLDPRPEQIDAPAEVAEEEVPF
ncbi:MAG: single-stranded DNA-binding protein [Oscillochloris sp.]|nr:single-stranded DNA-binding protein [Oscillochloris sp.]